MSNEEEDYILTEAGLMRIFKKFKDELDSLIGKTELLTAPAIETLIDRISYCQKTFKTLIKELKDSIPKRLEGIEITKSQLIEIQDFLQKEFAKGETD